MRSRRSTTSECTRTALAARITDAGTAHLDRLTWVTRHQLTWVTRHQLTELVAEFHPGRHAHVSSIIRELIGNT